MMMIAYVQSVTGGKSYVISLLLAFRMLGTSRVMLEIHALSKVSYESK